MLNRIHWATKYQSFEEKEADQAAIDPVEMQDEKCLVRVEYPMALLIRSATGEHPCCGSINWRRPKKTMVAGSLYERGSGKTVYVDPILGISGSKFPYNGRHLRVEIFRRRKLKCSTSIG